MTKAEDPLIFANRFQDADISDNGTITFTRGSKDYHKQRIYTPEDVMSHTLGYIGNEHNTSSAFRDNINNIRTTGNVYTAPMKNGSNEQYIEVIINDGTSDRRGYYKVFQSQAVPTVKLKNGGTYIPGTEGYIPTPTRGEAIRIATVDDALNKAAGLSASGVKSNIGDQLTLAVE